MEPATHSHRHDEPSDRRGIAAERRPDKMPAYASTSSSSSQRMPQPPRHGSQAPAELRLTEQTSDRAAGKRPREQQEPYRQPKRALHSVELTPADLRLAEHQLDSAEKRQLQAERERYRRQLSAPSRLTQTHNARLSVSMAQDNALARRMDCKLALPFLDENAHAQVNAHLLDKYLQMIANARRFTGPGLTHRDLDRCTELAAQYLYKTGWFDGASLKQLAHVANKLSKHPNQTACMYAIAWIAGEVIQADAPLGLDGPPSMLLLNAFAKNTDSARCERAAARLARHLLREHKAWQSMNAQGIGLVLNAFSKWSDNPDCQSIAQSLAELLASNRNLRHAMDAQSVANTLNALSKWHDAELCKVAASALALRLATERGLCNAFKPQEVGIALNALSKWHDTPDCKDAASALASRLANDGTLRNGLEAQGVAQVLNALSKWHDREACAVVASALASRLAHDRDLCNDLNSQGVVSVLNALSKWPDTPVCATAAEALAARLADDPGLCDALEGQHMANVLNALSKWPDMPDCQDAANALAWRLAGESRLRDDLDPQGMANALNALSKWPDTSICAAAVKALAARLAADPGLCDALERQHMTNALNALSKWPDTSVCATAAEALAARLAGNPGLCDALNPQEVANALNALSKWPDTPVCATAAETLAARLANDPGLCDALEEQHMANALNALSKWPDTLLCAAAVEALAARLADDPVLCDELEPQGVAVALNALSKWPDTSDCKDAANALALRLTNDPKLCDALEQQELGIVLNALSKWPSMPVFADAASTVASRLANEPEVCGDLNAQGVAKALNAMSKWPDRQDCKDAANALAARLLNERDLRNALNPLDMDHVLNALSKWPDTPVCATAAEALAARLAEDPTLCNALDPQGLTNALNALSKWPDTSLCVAVVATLASRLANDPGLCDALEGQHMANAINAFSKWPAVPRCTVAVEALAARLANASALCDALEPQEVAIALNALSKWPGTQVCADAASAVASRLANEPGLRHALDPQGVANTLNALSKWPTTALCAAAAKALASRLADDPDLCNALAPQGVANALNALSKWPTTALCAAAVKALASRLADDPGLCNALAPQGVANALNALSKWPDVSRCTVAVEALAARLANAPGLCDALEPQEVAIALNALSKWPGRRVCADAASAVASRLANEPDLRHALDLQGVANALNALSKWPATALCAAAAKALASRLANDPGLCNALEGQHMANVMNALSKWPDTPDCKDAATALASRLADDPALCNDLDPQGLANVLNALSKWPDAPYCKDADTALVSRLANDRDLCNDLDPQGVANVLNALSKWPDTPDCRDAANALASRLAEDPALCNDLDPQGVANVLNALSKWPDAPDCKDAATALASRLANGRDLCSGLAPQGVANVLNALSKWPDTLDCKDAATALASRLADDPALRNDLDQQGVANVLNALSKWPDTPDCRNAATALASRLIDDTGLCNDLDPQGAANVLNALSKWPDTPNCQDAGNALASRLANDPGLCNALNAQGVANALNALSKWPEVEFSGAATDALAWRLADERVLRNAMFPIELAQALNALSKWPGRTNCEQAIDVLADRLTEDHELRHAMQALDVAVSLNALSKGLERPACQTAAVLLAEYAGSAAVPWQQFEMRGLVMVANAMSRLRHLDDEQLQTLGGAKLRAMAGYLELHRERFEAASAGEIGVLFKALASAQLHRQMRPLAGPALERVSALAQDDGLRETNLEGLGNLCMGLLPLIRNPELIPRHRSRALRLFNALQPIAERKIDLYLGGAGAQASADTDQHATRCPALSFFQMLKAYGVVSRQWKTRHVEGARKQVQQRREELTTWVERTLERTREAIEADLGEMSWNLIAQIEAGDQVFDTLDLRMAKESAKIAQAHPPSSFDLDSGRLSMRSAPGQPAAPVTGTGSTTHVVVDMRGKEISNNLAEADKPYSLFARLTGLPLVEVQLPGAISTFMLARTFNYQDEPWRFDMFGGSRVDGKKSASNGLSLPSRPEKTSLLPAFRYADTVPGSSLMQLAAKLAPQREDWSRMQRSLMEMVPSDHVVEGTLRLGFFDDVEGPAHPFKPLASDGSPLALCPNDGCGFLKLEVALCIPAFRKRYDAWQAAQAGQASQEQRELLAVDKGPSMMPAQALQHFPRDEAALREAREAMQQRLKALPPGSGELLSTYRLAVGGGYQGQRVRAVPSADDKVHLPRQRSQAFDGAGGPLLLGKPPYDKENLLPVPEERVATVAQGDATAEFLSQSFGIQYSYTGFDDGSGDDPPMLHSKGMLIVVPKTNWPADFANKDLVCSKEDLKTLSSWTTGRDRDALPRDMRSTGSLRLKDIVEPGRLGALPIAELRKRNMDTDGDDAFVYAGYPKLAALISRVMAEREVRLGRQQSFKPPKTATPAVDPVSGHYQAGRLSEIISFKRGQHITSAAATLASRFMAQPDELREAMARSMMFGTYDGIERDLRNGLREMLEGDARDPQMLAELRTQAQEAIGRAHMPEAREAAELLNAQLAGLAPGSAASSDAPRLPDALAEAFPLLAQAYEAAPGVEARIHAILDNYPVCRLSHAQFPNGQPGLVRNEPELSMRNLFTIAIKVGTDALKSDTGTALFAKIVEACERSERAFAERVSIVPYGKATARAMHEGRFDPERTKGLLQRMPSMAAGVMEDALGALQQAGLIAPPPSPAARLREVRREDIALQAQALRTRAREMEPKVTDMLSGVAAPHGGRLEGTQHQLKSHGSLLAKLERQMALKKQTLEEAVAGMNDALRYSLVLEPQDFTAGLRGVLAALDDQGHVRVKLSNHFNTYTYRQNFKAVNVTLRSPEGALWEIQFHTPHTFQLKEQFHDLYKRSFALKLSGASPAEKRELVAPALAAFSRVASPPGCDEIEDWEESSP
ncbi:type III secretion system effector protein [Xanthomonas cerealis pv. cerealis]|uniref:Type III secretion system effector protein n=1 Tax=Xanthomonas cerealis pv. cerealis TaxID=152263 RepID=A0A514EBN0_9XANT|nr:XopAD/skwp family type III secretion system effector [Xanthomonas translucens]QDI03461.1 type III secretion system effector protein [Xanthomonas translucens pv. cerealis]